MPTTRRGIEQVARPHDPRDAMDEQVGGDAAGIGRVAAPFVIVVRIPGDVRGVGQPGFPIQVGRFRLGIAQVDVAPGPLLVVAADVFDLGLHDLADHPFGDRLGGRAVAVVRHRLHADLHAPCRSPFASSPPPGPAEWCGSSAFRNRRSCRRRRRRSVILPVRVLRGGDGHIVDVGIVEHRGDNPGRPWSPACRPPAAARVSQQSATPRKSRLSWSFSPLQASTWPLPMPPTPMKPIRIRSLAPRTRA